MVWEGERGKERKRRDEVASIQVEKRLKRCDQEARWMIAENVSPSPIFEYFNTTSWIGRFMGTDRAWTRKATEESEWEDDDSMDSGKEPVDIDTVREMGTGHPNICDKKPLLQLHREVRSFEISIEVYRKFEPWCRAL